jgi:uncharacterized membrane protein YoaK (UPF0700 family)
VSSFLAELRETLAPQSDSRHGPLAPLLVTLTFVTGLVDAFSYLVLGHVFVANMTGNVVFLGFALAGARAFSITASLVALAAFWCGALAGGRIGSRLGDHRGRLLSTAAALEAGLLAAAVALAALSPTPVAGGYRYAVIVVLAIAMGVQNAVARRLAVPDLTTTVLTLTITGTAADSTFARGRGSAAGRRLVAVAAMLVGALVGALLVVHVHIVYPLVAALVVVAIVAVATRVLGASDPPWTEAK